MGEFFESLNVKTPDGTSIVQSVRHLMKRFGFSEAEPKRFLHVVPDMTGDPPELFRVLITPAVNGWVTLYLSQIDVETFILGLARELKLPMIYFNLHDGDVLYYTYYDGGKMLDSFCSIPDYFGTAEEGMEGQPENLSAIAQDEGTIDEIKKTIYPENEREKYDGYGMLEKLSNSLGIQDCLNSFHYIFEDNAPNIDTDYYTFLTFENRQRFSITKLFGQF